MEGNEAAAVAAQSRYNSTQRLVETYQEQVERQEVEFKNLLDAKVKLEARLATMKQEREELPALLELAKSKETTVKAMKSLQDLMGSGDADISALPTASARLDKASPASEMRAASLDEQMDEVLERSALDAQLAERKKKLGLAPNFVAIRRPLTDRWSEAPAHRLLCRLVAGFPCSPSCARSTTRGACGHPSAQATKSKSHESYTHYLYCHHWPSPF